MSDPGTPTSGPPTNTSGVALEQLDTLVRVTTVHAWISLGSLFVFCAGAILFAVLYKVPKKVTGEGILLIKQDRLIQVRALGTGRLEKLGVMLGQEIHPGDEIGEISQEDLRDTIRETQARLDELRNEDRLLTEFEANEKKTQEQAIDRLRDSLNQIVENSIEGLGIAERIVAGSRRLRLISQLSNLDYPKDFQQKYPIKNDFNTGKSRLAELELTRLTANNQRQRLKLQRQLEISKLATKLKLDEAKHKRTSRILSHSHGTVTQILTATDAFVRDGAPVVLLSSPKANAPGMDDLDADYDSIVFVPAGEGKKINELNFVEVMPATVKREEHGFIHGKVVAVSELPATRLAMEAALQHPDLVDAFLKRYAPGVLLRVQVKLTPEEGAILTEGTQSTPPIRNLYHWSSSSGPEQPLKTGTMCEAAIVVQEQRLITLVLPWLKKSLGMR